MLEWSILLILIPAIVVPVVMLLGFAGCDWFFNLHRLPPTPPVIVDSRGTGLHTATVSWTFGFPAEAEKYEIKRGIKDDVEAPTTFFTTALEPNDTFDPDALRLHDTGLDPGTIYVYWVRAITPGDDPNSDWSPPAEAKTFSFYTTFEWKDYEETLSRDVGGWAGFCIVQRIEAVRLSKSGNQVRVTLRASSTSDASIRRVYISRASDNPPYDPLIDLTPIITTTFTIAANSTLQLPLIDYNLNESAPLLIAIDFAMSPPSGIRTSDHAEGIGTIHVPPEEAQTFFKPAAEEAAAPERTGFDPTPGINLVYKIEVVAL